ncbi:hypothetical protein CALCODRAFT_518552 [Calocera cornea HHB12733]|uniref:Uncharacterized protein n=1 Tax=Calocera cornea HHB12733 TaxID=1353952 RepID=A0A165EXU7_9BASI|nr:hypothetical protein CALCODRAFT_518552 [Calocera cornea HHB12733]
MLAIHVIGPFYPFLYNRLHHVQPDTVRARQHATLRKLKDLPMLGPAADAYRLRRRWGIALDSVTPLAALQQVELACCNIPNLDENEGLRLTYANGEERTKLSSADAALILPRLKPLLHRLRTPDLDDAVGSSVLGGIVLRGQALVRRLV